MHLSSGAVRPDVSGYPEGSPRVAQGARFWCPRPAILPCSGPEIARNRRNTGLAPVSILLDRFQTIEIEGVKTTTDQLIRPAETPETRQAAPTELEDSLQLFFNEARRHPLLTAAEEVELAKRIE